MPNVRAQLRSSLVARYLQLRERLAVRLGSRDLAGEALHETWLKLHDRPDEAARDLGPVADPDAYLYRAVLNTASKLGAQHRRMLGTVEIDAILNLADDAPDPERTAIARSELAHVERVLRELTPRQRDIFTASYAGRSTHAMLAKRHKVSVRLVQMELRTAILHCARRSGRRNLFAPGALRVSREQG